MGLDISIGDLAQNPVIAWLVVLLLLIWVIRDLVKNLPLFLKFKAIVYIPLVRFFRYKKFEKEAIRSDIQGTINYAVSPLIEELPSGSLKPLEIEYANNADINSFIRENKIFVRIRPVQNEDENFINVIRVYLEMALIPDSKTLLTEEQRKSITYFTTQKIVEGRKTLINKLHDEYFLPDTHKYSKLNDYFQKIVTIDKKGLFYSIMIRIIEKGASNLRFKTGTLSAEFENVLDHLVAFIKSLKSKEKNESVWKYQKPGITFSILLVAKPEKTFFVKPESYVNRLKDDLKTTDWVFVVFSQAESRYGARVANAIESADVVDLVDSIKSGKDYRGKNGGIVRLYAKKDKLKNY